jgi:hypothetical protein
VTGALSDWGLARQHPVTPGSLWQHHALWGAGRLVDGRRFLFFYGCVGLLVTGEKLMFGFTEEQIAAFGMSFGVGGLMLYMLFIIAQLAWESKAGKFGFFVMMLGLAFGMIGFVAKFVIQWVMKV